MISPRGKGSVQLIIISILAIFISGLFFGITYFLLSEVQTSLEAVDCVFPVGTAYADCQEWFNDTIYNLLNVKGVLVAFSYIFIFVLVLGMLVVGYQTGANPIFMGIYLIASIILTYCSSLISNIYIDLLDNPIVYQIMQPFTVYNKIMLNFPLFIGIIAILSISLSIVNYQRVKVNSPSSTEVLDY